MGGKIGVVRKMDFLCCIIFEEEKFTYSWDDDKKKNTLFFTTIRLSPKKFANELLIKLYFLYFAKNDSFNKFTTFLIINQKVVVDLTQRKI